ncbi:MAG: hypothetical protein JW741_24815, partial [Sedimentisphaerales bacterium]|nr:hypothetical protein [Sedimentisphaerales bacterium]
AAAAQLTVSAATLKVGVLAGMVGVATTKTAIVSMTAAGALAVGAAVTDFGPSRFPGFGSSSAGKAQIVSPLATLNGGPQKFDYFFPDGPGGAVMLRAEPKAEAGKLERRVLQNREGNYNFQGNVVYVNNHRAWSEDLSVMRLPTDSLKLRAFLAECDGVYTGPEPVSVRGENLLVSVERDDPSPGRPWVVRHENVLEEDYFQIDAPVGARLVDHRDAMHSRGWTYFRVNGQINGADVRGTGRMPFVNASVTDYGPWLRLKVADKVTVEDTGRSAYVTDAEGTVLSKHTGGSFFRGLGRPWMGLHAIDTVRRDAAYREARFETAPSADGSDVEITVVRGQTRLVYTIDLENDLVEEIAFFLEDAPVGTLEFEYLQDLENAGTEFAAPRAKNHRMSLSSNQGMLWLMRLANGTLGR